MRSGTVRWFNNGRGYGYIADDEGGDVYVHHSNILMNGYRFLEAGERVCFYIESTEKGNMAINVFREKYFSK